MLIKRLYLTLVIAIATAILNPNAAFGDATVSCFGNSILLEGDTIAIDPNFKGAVIVSLPDGDILLLEPGDPIPDIPAGSVIEVFDGEMSVSAANGIRLACGAESCDVTVTLASVKILDDQGNTQTLNTGESIKLSQSGLAAKAKEAPPTSEIDPTGGTPVEDIAEPDSRNIAQSPSQ